LLNKLKSKQEKRKKTIQKCWQEATNELGCPKKKGAIQQKRRWRGKERKGNMLRQRQPVDGITLMRWHTGMKWEKQKRTKGKLHREAILRRQIDR